MKRAEDGLTIIEVIISLAVVTVLATVPLLFFVPASQTDYNSRQRTLAVRAAETWLDRYRANQEPILARPGCVVSGSTMTCTYAQGATYASTDLTAIMSPFSHIVTVTNIGGGTNVNEWSVTANTSWKLGNNTQTVRLTTRMAY